MNISENLHYSFDSHPLSLSKAVREKELTSKIIYENNLKYIIYYPKKIFICILCQNS